jgi:hypothetical protein
MAPSLLIARFKAANPLRALIEVIKRAGLIHAFSKSVLPGDAWTAGLSEVLLMTSGDDFTSSMPSIIFITRLSA